MSSVPSFDVRARLVLRGCVVALAALACAAPSSAAAAGEPEIIGAGIDATDRFVVTWRLAPVTTFDFLEFSSVAIANPFLPGGFAGKNVVASACAPPGQGCTAPASLGLFRPPEPVARDRRYYVKVNAQRGANGRPRSSAIWVIDQSKPTRPGGGVPAAAPTNTPVLGMPYKAPAPNTIPAPKVTLVNPPKRIAAVIKDGVRVQVDCPVYVCYAIVALQLGKTTLVFSDTTISPGKAGAFLFRPRPATRARLQRRTKARLVVSADIRQPGEKRTLITRSFRVRR